LWLRHLDGATEDREADALLIVGLAHFHAGSLAEAETWFNHGADAAADGDEQLQARIDLALANVEQHLGHDLRAYCRVERVLRVLTHGGDRQALIGAQACLGRSKLAAGEAASAAWTFGAALQLLPDPDTDPSEAAKTVRRALALLAVESNDLAAAREYLSVLWESPEPSRAPAGL